jgi:hypothetical protein
LGIVATFMDRRIGTELNERGVVVWYDPTRAWQPWIEAARGKRPPDEAATAAKVTIGGRHAHLVVSAGSHYEVLQSCEPLVSGSEPPRLLVYVPGEPYIEILSPLRELECLGGEKEPYQRELAQVARQAFQSAGLSESKIDELLNRTGLDFAYLDSISVGDGGTSPLAPVFGSSRELDVFPSFLAEPERRADAASKGLLPEVARLAVHGLGLHLSAHVSMDQEDKGESMAADLSRALLVAEMRSDLDGPEPVAISQIVAPRSPEQVERVRAVCRKLRIEYADKYEVLADTVENHLRLADAGIDATTLGRIDTFRFEERRLLEACARLLVEGHAKRALEIVQQRSNSFWTSVARYPARHAEWQACGELAHLALETERVSKEVKITPAVASKWIAAYVAADGWHLLDQRHRRARHFLSAAQDTSALESTAAHVFARYDRVVEGMAEGFVAVLKESGWEFPGLLRQTHVYETRVAGSAERTAYLLVDALRYEMAAELVHQLLPMGATSLRLEPAIAAAPSITPVGMAALLPGAARSFSIAETPKGVAGSVGGQTLKDSLARMDHAKGAVPGLVEVSLDDLNGASSKKISAKVSGASVVIVRSTEIDGAGEQLPNEVAKHVMTLLLNQVSRGVRALANAGITRFVIAADHGHIFGSKLGDDMKIDPPEGGTAVEVHRRCWIGRGGSTPSSCIRIAGRELGYATDLDLVVPKGAGVFKAGGDLAYHHGGLSIQEMLIPVLTFELKAQKPAGKAKVEQVSLAAPREVTNRIFSVRLTSNELSGIGSQHVRVLAVNAGDRTAVGHAAFATAGWDAEMQTIQLPGGALVDVGLQLDDDEVEEIRVVIIEVGSDRVMTDSEPIPVKLLR